jgi:hypothetical protein
MRENFLSVRMLDHDDNHCMTVECIKEMCMNHVMIKSSCSTQQTALELSSHEEIHRPCTNKSMTCFRRQLKIRCKHDDSSKRASIGFVCIGSMVVRIICSIVAARVNSTCALL